MSEPINLVNVSNVYRNANTKGVINEGNEAHIEDLEISETQTQDPEANFTKQWIESLAQYS